MTESEAPPEHRSGFVAVVGGPSVGKSSLINALLRQTIAAVSPRPQTTRRRQLGILTLDHAQVIFVDTPGIHRPQHKLGEWMVREAQEALADADAILVVFDISLEPQEEDLEVARRVGPARSRDSVLVALNKVDKVPSEEIEDRRAPYVDLLPDARMYPVSATRGDDLDSLLQQVIALMPLGPRYYDKDDLTDRYEREITEDLIRAAALRLLHDEVPYCLTVQVEEFLERGDAGAYIRAMLYVERETQKGIVIGRGGRMLREIGWMARRDIEGVTGRKVYLDLRVKVMPGWRNDPSQLRRLGFAVRGE